MKLDKIKFKKTDGLTKFLVKRGQLFHISILGGRLPKHKDDRFGAVV